MCVYTQSLISNEYREQLAIAGMIAYIARLNNIEVDIWY